MSSAFHRISSREVLLVALPVAVLMVAGAWFSAKYMTPAPPNRIVLTTGGPAGAYHAFAQRYEKVLARANVKLEMRTSAGSLENFKRLNDPKSGVDAGFLQGGIATSKEAPDLVSIGRLFHEPLWIFYRGDQTFDRLPQLRGKRLAVGPEGSGTRHMVMQLLAQSGITAETATLLPVSGQEAVDALKGAQADAVFLVVAPEAPIVQALLRDSSVRIMSLAQADAYTKLFPYLTKLVLPQGVVDLVRNVPASDVALLAPSAVLLARDDLHPALVNLLAQAASEVHGRPSLFAHAGEFPKPQDPEFPVSDNAARFYKNGPPFLQRYLPFWVANLVERMLILAVPLLTVLFPLFKILPALYRWRVRSRMLYWYGQLKKVEANLESHPTAGQMASLRGEVERIEDEVNDSPVPLGFSEQFYNLRGHINLVRQRLGSRAVVAA